jgi:hypothetical protein
MVLISVNMTNFLSTCWRALGLPAADEVWTNAMTLDYFRVQQRKVAAFASGMMHARLGVASGVSLLDEQLVAALKCHVTRMLSNTHRTLST